MNTVTQQVTQQNSENPKPTCHHCKKPGHYRNQWRQLKREKDQTRNNTNTADNNNKNIGGGQTKSNSNDKIFNDTNANNTNNEKDRRPRPAYPPFDTRGKANHSTEKGYFGANAANRPLPRNGRPDRQNQVKQRNADTTHTEMSKLQLKLQTINGTSSLRSCLWQTGDNWNTKTSTNSRGCLGATLGDIYKSM